MSTPSAFAPAGSGAAPRPAATCPLCGGPNGCVPAACGSFDAKCWCADARFDAALLARARQAAPDAPACICARCAAGVTPACS